ncbi:protease modulator HflC [Ilyobacter polytropus]|uniref:Protein HflC n=1 Tax=Ilyobacter polytropus (strain ATCC 51220 / DSM 2926 / LMG 16218 / CuHBu1) TaxID=572544 RepID=E3H848_ILYPC|nr:protease modulator HflC [Ilyobacter polytropus]ADO83279.1 HflC protein [Ilyobacter polytropus DSM 2926]
MKKGINVILILIVIVFASSVFQVSEVQRAVVLRFGKPVGGEINTSGLKFKVPFIDNVVYFDKRLLDYDAEPKDLITKDKKNIVIDNYARWRIIDPLLFLQTVQDEKGAQARLDDIIYSEIRERLGQYTFLDIIAFKRDEIMETVTRESWEKTKKFGIEIVDVRIKRAELPKENEENVYRRMEAERHQQAKKYRAEGQEKALEITSQAEKERTVILAEAYEKSESIKGEGDAEALKIYADAYNRDPEFYKFTRTLSTYDKILSGSGKTKIIMSTESELWKILNEK